MKNYRMNLLGAAFAVCVMLFGFTAAAAKPAAYLQKNADVYGFVNLEAIAGSSILIEKGIDLEGMFAEAIQEDDSIPFASLPTGLYFSMSGVNEAINSVDYIDITPEIIAVVTGSEDFIDELEMEIIIDDETMDAEIPGLDAYCAMMDEMDTMGYAAKVDDNTFIFAVGLDKQAFAAAAAGKSVNLLTQKDFSDSMLMISADVEDSELAMSSVIKLFETKSDIRLEAVADFHDEEVAAVMAAQLQEILPTVPALLAGMGAAESVEAANNIDIKCNGSEIKITIPAVDVIAGALIPLIIMSAMEDMGDIDRKDDEDFDFDDEDFDFDDEDFDFDDEDFDWE